ncbi:DUF3422 domain-containing protein [Mesorhizobium sp. AR02]|nr:DUF3422 domain-containing protein [Mesorhizobium sp. AR02]
MFVGGAGCQILIASPRPCGASRAYQNIGQVRLTSIRFQPIAERETFPAFRRMAPTLPTCASLEERQINLSRKLACTMQPLRAKVDIEMEAQNREMLSALSERAQMQLRLQQTVEGRSQRLATTSSACSDTLMPLSPRSASRSTLTGRWLRQYPSSSSLVAIFVHSRLRQAPDSVSSLPGDVRRPSPLRVEWLSSVGNRAVSLVGTSRLPQFWRGHRAEWTRR